MNKLEWLTHIETVIEQGPYKASMTSLKAYTPPDWYVNGKFGIFIHWGPYCVPGFYGEWYPREMYQPGHKCYDHHLKTYGPHKEFGYKDFIPLMTAEQFDPDDWARLFSDSGARFVVPVAEHHDGFQMYNSELSRWNASQMGPKRDILGDLRESVVEQGMVFGASSHRAEHYWFMDGVHKIESDYTVELEDLYGPAMPAPTPVDVRKNDNPPSADFLDDWLIRTCELVDRYRPQLIWFDWWINNRAFRPYLEKFAAFYYNRAAEWGLGVAINYKFTAYDKGCAVFDVERGQLSEGADFFWQNDTSVSKNAWGYTDHHEYKQTVDLLCNLADIVSKNGALLLNVGPKADGTIPEAEREMLLEIGRWLAVNGEAIYGTRPWRVFGEGATKVPEGPFTDTSRDAFTGADIRYTRKEGTLYAMVLGRPETNKLVLTSIKPEDELTQVEALSGGRLEAHQMDDGLHIALPEAAKDWALPFVVKIN